MTLHDWGVLCAPIISNLVIVGAAALGIWLSGLGNKTTAWLTAHHQAGLASAVASANAVIQPAIQTGASVIAGKIASGQLDYTNRAAITAEAEREVDLVKARVRGMLAIAAPAEGALVASMMGKIDAAMVTATPLVAPSVGESVSAAAAVIKDAQAAIQSVGMGVAIVPPPAAAIPAPAALLDATGAPLPAAVAA